MATSLSLAKNNNSKIKIGVHWKDLHGKYSNSPRLPKLIELDHVSAVLAQKTTTFFSSYFHFKSIPLSTYISNICAEWAVDEPDHYSLRFDDTHKFVTEENRHLIPTGQVFYLSYSYTYEAQDIIKLLISSDQNQRSKAIDRLKLASVDETFAIDFIERNGLNLLIQLMNEKNNRFTHQLLIDLDNFSPIVLLLFSDEFFVYTPNLLRSIYQIMTNQHVVNWDKFDYVQNILDKLIPLINGPVYLHSSVICPTMMILHSILTSGSRHSQRVLQEIRAKSLFEYCGKLYDSETQYYALSLINLLMSKGDQAIRTSVVKLMSDSTLCSCFKELVQAIISCNTNNEEISVGIELMVHSVKRVSLPSLDLSRTLSQQLCRLQRYYLNETYSNSMTKSANRHDAKSIEMINEIRKCAYDSNSVAAHFITSPNHQHDLNNNVNNTDTVRRSEALQRNYERLGFQDTKEPIKDFQLVPPGVLSLENLNYFCTNEKNDFIRFVLENSCKTIENQCPLIRSAIVVTKILCELFRIGIDPAEDQQIEHYFLLFYTIPSFFEQCFVRCTSLFNKTWKEMRAKQSDFDIVVPVIKEQIFNSLSDVTLNTNDLKNTAIKKVLPSYSPSMVLTPLSPVSSTMHILTSAVSPITRRFTFEYFCDRLNFYNYKEISKISDESELEREKGVMKLPVVETLKEHLRPHVESLTRQARLRTMKKGQIFMTYENRTGVKKIKNRLMHWQLFENEKGVQCSEVGGTLTKDSRDSNNTINATLMKTMILIENIKDVQCNVDRSNVHDRTPKINRHSNSHVTIAISIHNDLNYTLYAENDYDMYCWSDGFNILLNRQMESFYAKEDMESLLNLQCQLQMLELEGSLITISEQPLTKPSRLPPPRH
ncbi:unnamed protein product [Didymodactylos carnosus]|uniref:ELMO domain-containing protein n=2 Tax=Didymodactylos carnosus TaxID=1234261 RepID=A0A814APT5_9BILA|nr:unnamed protein product [Didymodactylos carnosus]CAF3698257.1 unnamed protein product [Didymodactylos carnosus]